MTPCPNAKDAIKDFSDFSLGIDGPGRVFTQHFQDLFVVHKAEGEPVVQLRPDGALRIV